MKAHSGAKTPLHTQPSGGAGPASLLAELKEEGRLHPGNRRQAMRRRAQKARAFPTNTCGASRHVHMMADALSTDGHYHMFEEEPLHCAGSLYAVVADLWEARTRLAELGEYPPTTASAVGMEAREAGRNEPITPHTGEEK